MNFCDLLAVLLIVICIAFIVDKYDAHLREKPQYDCEHDMRCEALVKHSGDSMRYVYICKKCGHTKKFRL